MYSSPTKYITRRVNEPDAPRALESVHSSIYLYIYTKEKKRKITLDKETTAHIHIYTYIYIDISLQRVYLVRIGERENKEYIHHAREALNHKKNYTRLEIFVLQLYAQREREKKRKNLVIIKPREMFNDPCSARE